MTSNALVKELILQGNNYAEVGKKLNLSRERIRQIAKEMNINIKTLQKENPKKYSRRKFFSAKCPNCGKRFERYYKTIFCSRRCYGTTLKEVTPEKQNQSFRYINHKGKTKRPYRLIMEKYLKRKLNSKESIHHIDKNIRNNKLSNLRIMSKGAHTKLHRKEFQKKFQKLLSKKILLVSLT